jgi:hypothetical protein
MHGKTKVMPKFAYIAGIGCFPNELKAEVEKLFPDKWLPGAITSIGGEGITEITGLTTADKDVEIAHSYFQTAVKQAKAWLNDPNYKKDSVTIKIYIDPDFLAAVKKKYPKNSRFRNACEAGGRSITRVNMNDDWSN